MQLSLRERNRSDAAPRQSVARNDLATEGACSEAMVNGDTAILARAPHFSERLSGAQHRTLRHNRSTGSG